MPTGVGECEQHRPSVRRVRPPHDQPSLLEGIRHFGRGPRGDPEMLGEGRNADAGVCTPLHPRDGQQSALLMRGQAMASASVGAHVAPAPGEPQQQVYLGQVSLGTRILVLLLHAPHPIEERE